MTNTVTGLQNRKILNFLTSGKDLSAAQARSMFGVRAHLGSRIAELREAGYPVYTNVTGGQTTYRLGSPSRAMIAAAYASTGATLFR
jgi:hypothetical protein